MNLSSSIFEPIQRVNTRCLTGHLAPRVSAIPVRKLHPSTQIRLFPDGKHIPLEPYFCPFSVRQDPIQNITRSTTSTWHIIIVKIYHFPVSNRMQLMTNDISTPSLILSFRVCTLIFELYHMTYVKKNP